MSEANHALSGGEILMLIEALDALLPYPEDGWRFSTPEERQRWEPYVMIRRRLKEAMHMSFCDQADGWLAEELRRERIAVTDELFSHLVALLRDAKATRRTVRESFAARMRELREERLAKPKPLS